MWGTCLNPLFIRSQIQIPEWGYCTEGGTIYRLNPLFIRSQIQIDKFDKYSINLIASQSLIHQVSDSDPMSGKLCI